MSRTRTSNWYKDLPSGKDHEEPASAFDVSGKAPKRMGSDDSDA